MNKPDPYLIEAAVKVLDVLELFRTREEIRLTDVVQELGLIKSTAFRLLYTLEHKGYVERTPGGRTYRRRRRFRIGMASIAKSIPFVAEIEQGFEAECRQGGFELLLRHHEFDPKRLLQNVDELLEAGIAVLVCYNPDEHLSHVIADRCAQASIPIIAITFPVPGARLFGINNYRAGLAGGVGLGEEIVRRWGGVLDYAVVIDIPENSPAQQARITGMIDGLRQNITLNDECVLHRRIDRRHMDAEQLMGQILHEKRKARRIAVLSYNDVNALGAVSAVNAAHRSDHVLILSQGGAADVREELRRPASPLWGTVAHFPERFGPKLVRLIRQVVNGDTVPATTYSEHIVLTRANLALYYKS